MYGMEGIQFYFYTVNCSEIPIPLNSNISRRRRDPNNGDYGPPGRKVECAPKNDTLYALAIVGGNARVQF